MAWDVIDNETRPSDLTADSITTSDYYDASVGYFKPRHVQVGDEPNKSDGVGSFSYHLDTLQYNSQSNDVSLAVANPNSEGDRIRLKRFL